MPSLGDLLQSILGAAGEGALHNRAVATRGGDYRLKDAAALDAQKAAAIGREGAARNFRSEDALNAALAELAKRRGFAEEGVGPEQGAAAFKVAVEDAKRELAEKLGQSQIDTNASLIEQRGNAPDEKERDRELKLLIQQIRDEAAAGRAGMAANRPQIILVPQADGTVVPMDKRRMPLGQPVGQKPPSATERKDEAGMDVMVEDARTAQNLVQKPEVQEAMGPLQGLWTIAKRATVGVPDDVATMTRTLDNLGSQLGLLRSGQAVSEQEFQRLQRLLGSIRSNPQTARQNLAAFTSEIERTAQKRFGHLRGAGGAPMSPGQPTGGGDDADPLGILR